jgi:glutathione S-transferase
MNIDKTHLTPEQRREIRAWEEFFASDAYRLFTQRFAGRYQGIGALFKAARGAQALGHAQGREEVLREVKDLEKTIEGEYRVLVGELEGDAQDDREAKGAMA